MPPRAVSPVRGRAVELLRDVLERGARAAPRLTEAARDLSPADRDLLREIVLGVLRWRSALDAEIASLCRVPLSRLAPDLREILEVALYQIRHLDRVPAYAAVDEAVRHARQSGGEGGARLVNAVLRNLLRRPAVSVEEGPGPPREASSSANASEDTLTKTGEGPFSAAALSLRFSHPEFLVARWLARFGVPATLRILEADNSPSPVDLMVNPRKTSRVELAAALREEGIETELSDLSALALSVVSGNALQSPLFAGGHFSVQDVGSQALALLLPPGEMLIDLAAAPGGKSLAAVALGRAKRTIAMDKSLRRLRLVEENRRRLAIAEVRALAGDFLDLPIPGGHFDRVLFDAPCSGTGTLRKNPEIRYRVTPQAIERLSKAQEQGLAAAAGLLAPGGYLLYSTCSLEEEENERVIERVLSRMPELEPADIEASDGLAPFISANRFRLLPDTASDGFTAHLIRRSR